MSKHVPPPTGEPLEQFAVPQTPEEAFQAIGQLRKTARDEIDRLIRFLDKTDDYVSRELEEAVDDVACDDDELDGPENAEDEPSLGSSGHGDAGPISYTCHLISDGFDMVCDCEGDEHDGREPNVDDEPSLCGINADCKSCCDKDYEQDLGSYDRMMDQTRSTAVRSNWTSVEGGELDPT